MGNDIIKRLEEDLLNSEEEKSYSKNSFSPLPKEVRDELTAPKTNKDG